MEEKIELLPFDYNKPDSWACRQINVTPNFDVEGYQKKIDAIVGKSENGHSMVRLVWAGDIQKCYTKFYTSWTSTGMGMSTELRARYKYASIQIPSTPDIIDIPPARWMLEEYHHPGQYLASSMATRFNSNGQQVKPDPSREGYYDSLITIATHTATCCEVSHKEYKVCWGLYRQPGQVDLERLRRAVHLREHDHKIDTTNPLDIVTMERIGIESARKTKTLEDLSKAEIAAFVDEHFLELLSAMTGQEFSDKTKKYSLPNKQKESGIITL